MHKIVLDENISYTYTRQLEELGYIVYHIGYNTPSITDPNVLQVAASHSAVLITHDTDFGRIVFYEGYSHVFPIVLIRDPDHEFAKVFKQLTALLKKIPIGQYKTFATVSSRGYRLSNR